MLFTTELPKIESEKRTQLFYSNSTELFMKAEQMLNWTVMNKGLGRIE